MANLLGWIGHAFRDLVDANTEDDKKRRLAQQLAQPRPSFVRPPTINSPTVQSYTAQQQSMGLTPHTNPFVSFGNNAAMSFYHPVEGVVKAGIVNPIELAAANISHNNIARQNVVEHILRENNPRTLLGNSAQVATMLLGGPVLRGATKLVDVGAGLARPSIANEAANAVRLGLPQAIPKAGLTGRTVAGGITGGVLNTSFGAGAGVAAGESPKQLLQSAPKNFALGAGFGVAGPLAGATGRQVIRNQRLATETGAIGKNVNKPNQINGWHTPVTPGGEKMAQLQSSGLPRGTYIALDKPFASDVHNPANAVKVTATPKKIYDPDGVMGKPSAKLDFVSFANKNKVTPDRFGEQYAKFLKSHGYDSYVRGIDGNPANRELIVFDKSAPQKPSIPPEGQVLHRVDRVGAMPNAESLQNYGVNRGTGGHGTGLYFNLKEQPINGNASGVVRTKINSPMENPFVIKTFDQSGAVNIFGRTLLHHVTSPKNATLADVKAAAKAAGIKWDENLAKQAVNQTRKELNGLQPGISEKALASVDQPINHYMKGLGHDGIINHGVDNMGGGSVIFRGTKAYEKATQLTQPTQGAKPATPKVPVKAGSVPSLEDFKKMIPAVKGTKLGGPLTKREKAGLAADAKIPLSGAHEAGPPTRVQIASGVKANPYKSNVHEVTPGNWEAARNAGDAVTGPIDAITRFTKFHLKQLKKSNPSAYKNFLYDVNSGKASGAAAKWNKELTDAFHKEANALGIPTPYRKGYDQRILSQAMIQKLTPEQIASGEAGSLWKSVLGRKYENREDFVKAVKAGGGRVEEDAQKVIDKYVSVRKIQLHQQALRKAFAEADQLNLKKRHTIDFGGGVTLQVSDEGLKQVRGVLPGKTKTTKLGRVYDVTNSVRKGALLSVSQFHSTNIMLRSLGALLTPKPGNVFHRDLTAGVHPVRAGRAVYGTYRPLLPGGEKYVMNQLEKSYGSGDLQFAARHGTKFGQVGYGKGKANLGHKMVFDKQLQMIHKELVPAARRTLEKYGVPEGSPEAMKMGEIVNSAMGFINYGAINTPRWFTKAIDRLFLAGQFTPSKLFNVYKGVTTGGPSGSWARAETVGNAAVMFGVIAGLSHVLGQKSDNARDLALRTLIDPAAPTNIKDKKDNDQEVRVPMTNFAEVAHILGVKLARQKDGHLGVTIHPSDQLSKDGPLVDWLRARLSPNLNTGVRIATNTEFGNKPMYEEGAPAGKQAIQVATKEIQGALPIGIQGLGYSDVVKKHVPASAREVLDAGTPSTNPLVKSLAGSTGFSIRTSRLSGKGAQTSTHFSNVDWGLKQAKNDNERGALQSWLATKKNSVTGKYDVLPTVNDSRRKATDLLGTNNYHGVDVMIGIAKRDAEAGLTTDPLWSQPRDQVIKYLQYQAMPPGGADRKHWQTLNEKWYEPLRKERDKFFNSLPPGDPNKPNAPIEYPEQPPAIQRQMNTYDKITDDAKAAEYISIHPDVQKQFDKISEYNNAMRKAQGYGELDSYPRASSATQKLMDEYNALPKNDGPRGGNKTRSLWIRSHSKEWAAMTQAWTQQSIYNLEKDAGQAQFKDAGFSQKGLKAIYNLGQYDVGKYTDKNGNDFYALSGDGTITVDGKKYTRSGGSGGGGRGGSGSGGRLSIPSYKTATSSSVPKPKAVRVTRKPVYKKPALRKLTVDKIPTISKKSKVA